MSVSAIDTLTPDQQRLYEQVVLEGLVGDRSFLTVLRRCADYANPADLEAVRVALLADAKALGRQP